MIRKIEIVFLIMLTVSSAGIVFAGDIYKWIDADGNVHFGDRPTPEKPLADLVDPIEMHEHGRLGHVGSREALH